MLDNMIYLWYIGFCNKKYDKICIIIVNLLLKVKPKIMMQKIFDIQRRKFAIN